MARPELTVRGGGIFGLSIAWEAASRGARVRLIETASIGAGSSGGIVGALAPHTPEQWNEKKAFQLESLLMAGEWWLEVEAASGLSAGYRRAGRLQSVPDEKALAAARQRGASAELHWHGRAAWSVDEVWSGWCPASASGWIIRDSLSARIQPRQALAALTAALQAKGGEVVIGEAGHAGPVIWATGVAGLRDLSGAIGRDMGGAEKGQALLLQFDAADQPQLFSDGLHIVPHADGTVAVGSTTERAWRDPSSTDDRLDALHRRAVEVCPALQGAEVVERWAGLRPRAKSRAPVLGEWPGRPGEFIANGGFKIGFGMAPKIAATMVDLALEGKDRIPEAFRLGPRE